MTGLLKSTAQVHTRTFGLKAHFCDTVEEGKEWLVSEDEGGVRKTLDRLVLEVSLQPLMFTGDASL